MSRNTWLMTVLFLTVALPATGDEPVVLDTDSFRLEIGRDGILRGLTSKPGTTQYAWTAEPGPVAMVYRGGRAVPASEGKYAASTGRWVYRGGESFPASRVIPSGDKLRIDFGKANVTATFRVTVRRLYLAFELVSLTGDPVDRIDLLRLHVKDLPQLGAWINLARNEEFGVCLCAGDLATNAEMDRHRGHVLLKTVAEKNVGLVGATAVLLGCNDPNATFLDAMAGVEHDFQMPPGADNRRRGEQRLSYLWASRPTPQNISRYIDVAKQGGFRMILFSYGAFSTGAGHFEWNSSYPGGMADLKRVTDAVRRAGLKLGLHIHYSKAHRQDAYVSPLPDHRLHAVRQFNFAADVDADTKTISVDRDPAGCTLDEERRILRAGPELIYYENYQTEPVFQFAGCRRGYLGTTASAHRKGEPLGLLNVDTWTAFIRYDQDTDIQDETARRIADIFRETGPYEMVYFDGAEDVHEPFWHNVASAQYRVFRLLEPAPPVCEAAHYTHFSWHMITRSNAYDVVAPADGMKDFCRLMPCPTAAARAKDFSRIDFGWLGRFGKSPAGCAGPDVWEYVASRAAAWDCPISLKITLDEIASNPRRDDCLAVLKTWEDARLANKLTESQLESLKTVPPGLAEYVSCYRQRGIWDNCRDGRDLTEAQLKLLSDRREHHLFINERGDHEMVPIEEIPGVADGAVKVYCFSRAERPDDTHILLWAVEDDVVLRLPWPPEKLVAMRPFGNRIPAQDYDGKTAVEIGGRTYIVLPGLDSDETRRLLDRSDVVRSTPDEG